MAQKGNRIAFLHENYPITDPDPSHSTMNVLEKSGVAKNGVVHMASNCSKYLVVSSFKWNESFNKSVRGADILP